MLGIGAALLFAAIWRYTHAGTFFLLLGCAALVLAALATTTMYAFVRPRDIMLTARRADSLLLLDERLATALEDARVLPANPAHAQLSLRQAQLDDALSQASRLLPSRDLPLRIEWKKLAPALGLLLLLPAIVLAPNPFQGMETQAAKSQVSIEQKKIEEFKEALAAQPRTQNDPKLQQLVKELDQLSRDLANEKLTREEAMARLSETENKLEKSADPQAAARKEALDQLAKQLATSDSQTAKEIGDTLKSGDLERTKESLKKASEGAKKLTDKEQKNLAKALKDARDQVVSLDPELASKLNEAASALDQGDAKAAEKALQQASEYIQSQQSAQATQEQINQALAQIQQSKTGIAQAGDTTPVALSSAVQTAIAQGTRSANGTPLSGTAVALSGTAVALGSPVKGQASGTGTPLLARGTPGKGTPVAAQGQGQSQGTGQGQGAGAGQGQGQGAGTGQGQNSSSGSGGGTGGNGWGTGHTDPVYAPPTTLNAQGTPVTVQGQNNPGGEQSSTTTGTDINNSGPAQVPYEQVYGEYKEQAGKALDSDYIPQGYKDLVRDYFTEIGP